LIRKRSQEIFSVFEWIIFWGFSAVMLFSSLMTITRKNPVPAAAYLILAMFCAAALYAQLGADFIAAIQVLVYAGAIMVLFVFVIMLLNIDPQKLRGIHLNGGEFAVLAITALAFVIMAVMMLYGGEPSAVTKLATADAPNNTALVSQQLFIKYLWPFELASLLILIAIVASVWWQGREWSKRRIFEVFSFFLTPRIGERPLVPTEYYFGVALLMFLCGAVGVLVRRNLIMVLMSVELMLNASNIVFVAASRHVGNVDGQVMAFFVMTVAACEAAVGLAMVIAIFRRYGTIDTNFLRILRG
jgi:NADH-quinone oxidoreductase subunit J